MSDVVNEQNIIKSETEDEILRTQISDESLEAAAYAGKLAAYTEFAWCTQAACPG